MTIAFAHFDEPLAWLIRGLITYGWADVTTNRVTPAQVVGGFDLSLIPDSQGKSGLILRVPAAADGRRCHEDDTYAFEVLLIHMGDARGFAVRCEACNYLAEFAFDPENPEWAAGYIHQGLTEYVAEFVRWRLGGGELVGATSGRPSGRRRAMLSLAGRMDRTALAPAHLRWDAVGHRTEHRTRAAGHLSPW